MRASWSERLRSLRLSVTMRLVLLYGCLFLGCGAVLLGLNYALVRATLPTDSDMAGLVVNVPDSDGGAPTSTSETTLTAEDYEQIVAAYRGSVLDTLLAQSVIALAAGAALAFLLGWIVARRALRPVHEITATARMLGADSLGERRLAMSGPRDELTELADTFDNMLDRLATSFDSQRRFVANASHELRTPLSTQRTLIEVAMRRSDAGPVMRTVGQKLLAMNDRHERLIEGLLTLARSDRGLPAMTRLRLDEIAQGVVEQRRREVDGAGLTLRVEVAAREIDGDSALMERLVTNLVDNAIKYNESGGAVWVMVGDTPALRVVSTGPVVPPERVEEMFEPFRRLGGERVQSSDGVGLGLSIVASVASAHGGSARALPRAGGGLVVEVALPIP